MSEKVSAFIRSLILAMHGSCRRQILFDKFVVINGSLSVTIDEKPVGTIIVGEKIEKILTKIDEKRVHRIKIVDKKRSKSRLPDVNNERLDVCHSLLQGVNGDLTGDLTLPCGSSTYISYEDDSIGNFPLPNGSDTVVDSSKETSISGGDTCIKPHIYNPPGDRVDEHELKDASPEVAQIQEKPKRSRGRPRKHPAVVKTSPESVAREEVTVTREEVTVCETQTVEACKTEYNGNESLEGLENRDESLVKQVESNKRLPKVKIVDKSSRYCFQCEICKKIFRSTRGLKEHKMAEHSLTLPYMCALCGDKFKFNNSLRMHRISKHSSVRDHVCTKCTKTFLTASHLKTHFEAVHLRVKKFVCRVCGKGFGYKNSRDQHERIHRGEKLYVCSVCERRFTTSSSLAAHHATHRSEKTSQCTYCGKFYKSEALLRIHTRRHTSQGFICDVCGRTFLYKSNLLIHTNTHFSARHFECKTCGKSFKTHATLYSHQAVHAETSPHSCTMCNKTFKTKQRLRAHEVRHTDTKLYRCVQCAKKFSSKGDLSKHMRTLHLNKQTFICNVCGKESTRADNLRVHMTRVHGYDPKELSYEKIMQMSEKLRSKPPSGDVTVSKDPAGGDQKPTPMLERFVADQAESLLKHLDVLSGVSPVNVGHCATQASDKPPQHHVETPTPELQSPKAMLPPPHHSPRLPATNHLIDPVTLSMAAYFNAPQITDSPVLDSTHAETLASISHDLHNPPVILPVVGPDMTHATNVPLTSFMLTEPFPFTHLDVSQIIDMNRFFPNLYGVRPPN